MKVLIPSIQNQTTKPGMFVGDRGEGIMRKAHFTSPQQVQIRAASLCNPASAVDLSRRDGREDSLASECPFCWQGHVCHTEDATQTVFNLSSPPQLCRDGSRSPTYLPHHTHGMQSHNDAACQQCPTLCSK